MNKTAIHIVKTLKDKGHIAYFAGGCVRDLIMKRPPGDIDIATSATPQSVLTLFPKTFEKGKAFGVVSVLMDDQEFEVATFRKEGKYSDGRHPDHVEWTDDKQDALRRDFTINGMFYDPIEEKVIDYVAGQQDIKQKIIRAIGIAAHRFDEDKLRMMRGVRFASRFQYSIESDTLSAIKQSADHLLEVSKERIRDEFVKILTQSHADKGLELLSEVGLLKQFLPEAEAMKGVEQPPQFHPEGDVWVHTLLVLKGLDHPSAELAVAALLHDIGKPPTFTVKERIRFDGHTDVGADMSKDIMKRLRFSNKQIEHVAEMVRQHLKFMHVTVMRKSTLKRFLLQHRFEDHLELHRLDCLACHGILENYEFCKAKLEEIRKEPPPVKPLLSGKDLIKLGFKPGILFKKILTDIETAVLEGEIKTRTEGVNWVKKAFSSHIHKGTKKNKKQQQKK